MNEWKKVIYRETPEEARCIQGYIKDVGDFLEVSGNYKQVLVSKASIVSIASKQGAEDEQRHQP